MESYTTITRLIAGLSLLTGILLIISPGVLIKAGELFNRVYNLESMIFRRRTPFGIIFILCGALLVYILY